MDCNKTRMLPIVFFAWLSVLPLCSCVVNCRTACRHCREKAEHPEMLEVYCAMCDECKQRRREWLEGAPSLLRVDNTEEYLTNYAQQDSQEECPTTPIDESCDDPPVFLTQTIPTTTTTTTTTKTTTTRRPCPPKPCVKTTRPPCQSLACPIPMMPMAIPVCNMCSVQMGASFYTVTPVQSSTQQSTTEVARKMLTGKPSATSELYFYLGVPKKLLKQLQLSRS